MWFENCLVWKSVWLMYFGYSEVFDAISGLSLPTSYCNSQGVMSLMNEKPFLWFQDSKEVHFYVCTCIMTTKLGIINKQKTSIQIFHQSKILLFLYSCNS